MHDFPFELTQLYLWVPNGCSASSRLTCTYYLEGGWDVCLPPVILWVSDALHPFGQRTEAFSGGHISAWPWKCINQLCLLLWGKSFVS